LKIEIRIRPCKEKQPIPKTALINDIYQRKENQGCKYKHYDYREFKDFRVNIFSGFLKTFKKFNFIFRKAVHTPLHKSTDKIISEFPTLEKKDRSSIR